MIYAVPDLKRRIEEVLVEYDLVRYRRTKAGVLSSGEGTRLGLAKAMLNKPRLLLLDEPTASIDPSTARDIRAGIAKFVDAGHCGVLWTSHNMYEVEAVCDRVLFLSRGKILLEGDPKTLPGQHGAASLDDLFVAVAHEALHDIPPGFVVAVWVQGRYECIEIIAPPDTITPMLPAPAALTGFLSFSAARAHDITMHSDVKARRCGALTLAVRYRTLPVHLQEAHLSKERVAKPPV